MKTLFSIFIIALLAIAFFSCTDESTSVVQSENALMKSGPSANGQGTLMFNGETQTFAFHAREKDGVVTGSIQCNTRNWDNIFHGEIDCMVVDGNMATLSGEITHDTGGWLQLYPDYKYFWFRIFDNGEGANAPPDEFSDIYAYIDFFPCDLPIPPEAIPMTNILNGNFQVNQ